MIEEVSNLIDQYWNWLRDKTKLRDIGYPIEITTPYLDRHNDRLQIYATKANGYFALTDDGYTIQELQISGCEPKTKKRRVLLETTLNGIGVHLKDDSFVVETTPENFAHKKHNLVQTMLTVNDLFYQVDVSDRYQSAPAGDKKMCQFQLGLYPREEQVAVFFEVRQRRERGRVQRHQTRFSKLGVSDRENARGPIRQSA